MAARHVAFTGQTAVFAGEGVDLNDVGAQYGAHGFQLLFQTADFCRIGSFGATQFGQERLGTCLCFTELTKQRIIFDPFFQLVVLLCELFVLVLHFAAIHVGQLSQFFELFVLVVFFVFATIAGREGKT